MADPKQKLPYTLAKLIEILGRAAPGGAIDESLSEKASAGYGLGAFPTQYVYSIAELDALRRNGWYGLIAVGSTLANVYFNYCNVFVHADSENILWQELRPFDDPLCVLKRHCLNGVWSEWDVENPPMYIGVEYRTTERHAGKPVYAKIVKCPDVAANTWTQVNDLATNVKDLVRFNGKGHEDAFGEDVAIPSKADGLTLEGFVSRTVYNTIYVKYWCAERGLTEVYFTLYYTKTTD